MPSPSGLFLQGTSNFLVGSGIGPLIFTPVRTEIDLICLQTLFTCVVSVPVNEIRAFWVKNLPLLIYVINYTKYKKCPEIFEQ